MTEVPAIYGALQKVMQGLANVPKTGQMKFGATSYEYLRADDVQEKLNPLLNENGIVVKSDYTVDTLTRGRGEGAPYVYVNLVLTYFAVADGSSLSVSAVGESQAGDDKSINKALTQAIKNAHRATFQFASGEAEPDDQAPATTATEPRVTPAQQKIATAQAKANSTTSGDDELKALQEKVRAVIQNKESPYDSDTVNALGAKIAKDAGKAKFVNTDKPILKKLVAALDAGEMP